MQKLIKIKDEITIGDWLSIGVYIDKNSNYLKKDLNRFYSFKLEYNTPTWFLYKDKATKFNYYSIISRTTDLQRKFNMPEEWFSIYGPRHPLTSIFYEKSVDIQQKPVIVES